jgi:ABC-2 type transport system permease protein
MSTQPIPSRLETSAVTITSPEQGAPFWQPFRTFLLADIREKLRDRRLFAILLVAALVSLAAAFTTAVALERKVEARTTANATELKRWFNQNPKYAHSAAHYGVYVFKPLSTLAAIEPGIEKFVGTSTWLEAHKQNEFIYRPAQDELAAARQAVLTPSFVIAVIAPLAMVFLGFGALVGERERGSLRLLRLTTAGLMPVAAARSVSLWIAGVALCVPGAMATAWVAYASASASPAFVDGAWRALSLTAAAALYLLFWAIVVVTVSALSRSSRAALGVLITLWALLTLALPRLAVEIADTAAPLPHHQAFRSTLDKALGEPHDPAEEARYKADVLKQYNVTDVKDLPVNWSGISLARGEARGDDIFDEQYGRLFRQMQAQSAMAERFAFVSPTIAFAALASHAAATDFDHHLAFTQAAEQQRRAIQKTMNDYITVNPDREGKRIDGNRELWAKIPKFEFHYPAAPDVGRAWQIWVSLLLLLGVVSAGAVWSLRRLSREVD